MLEINKIYNYDCIDGLKQLDDNSIDLVVTSPPYDDLRTYGKTLEWNFEVFKPIAHELYRVLKPGGVVVWVVGDATINGSETGTSAKQAEYFREVCGFKQHDTMIYLKNGSSRPASKNSKRYSQLFEYMFIFTKGDIRKDITLIADKRNKWAGWAKWGRNTTYDIDGNLVEVNKQQPVIAEYSVRDNVWKYSVSFNDKTGHPAVFPELLAQDHILSWSTEGDLVLDPFMGSGTTAKMAKLNRRNYIGFEKNTEYYEKSLERLAKYDGVFNTDLTTITIKDENGEDIELQYVATKDKELEAKTKLWNQKIEELNQYFNEQTLSTLKTLKFSFSTKTNDERVKKITESKDEQDMNYNTPETKITVDNGKPLNVQNTEVDKSLDCYTEKTGLDNKQFIELCMNKVVEYMKNNFISEVLLGNEELKELILTTVERYFQMKRLPDALVEINDRAREEKKMREAEQQNKIQKVVNSNDYIVDKPKRKRRTKAEMEAARKAAESDDAKAKNNIDWIDTTHYSVNGSTDATSTSENDCSSTITKVSDELPFEFTDEERARILGVELADIVDGKPEYVEPVVKVKKPRGRPRKNPII